MNVKFNDVTERDMDFLFIEEIASTPEFAKIFLKKIAIENADVIETEISKVSSEFGESDMTVIISVDDKRHALLIEDKIDAIAMPRQCNRYFKRGELGIKNGEYDSFDVFIVAPEKYLKENKEAVKYPNKVSYEECAKFFKNKTDNRNQFKYSQIIHSINKQKHGYQVIENEAVTDFWDKYITYKETKYPELWLVSKRGIKGARATWPHYRTVLDNMFIYHKSEFGYVDITIPNSADKIVDLETTFGKANIDLASRNMTLVKTGKSAAIRIAVPVIDFSKPFEDYANVIDDCFNALKTLTDFAKEISKIQNIVELINK